MDQVENYWIQAGGNAQAAAMAAAIADASSGLNPGVTRTNPDGTCSVGLWLIPQNGTPPGTTDPLSNARAAVQLSNNGTDWSQWCVAWSDNDCGQQGGTYLGSGANALGSLAQGGTSGIYSVAGSQPSGSGTGASTAAASSATPGGSTGISSKLLLVGALVLVIILIVWMRRRNQGADTVETDVTETPTP